MKSKFKVILISIFAFLLLYCVFAFTQPGEGEIPALAAKEGTGMELLSQFQKDKTYIALYKSPDQDSRLLMLEYRKIPFFNRYRLSDKREINLDDWVDQTFCLVKSEYFNIRTYFINLNTERVIDYSEQADESDYFSFMLFLFVLGWSIHVERKRRRIHLA